MNQPVSYQSRAEIPERYKWDLSVIYPDDAAWESALATLARILTELTAWQGKVGERAESLLGALLTHEKASRLIDRLWQYAARHRDLDMASSRANALFDRANGLRSALEEAAAFLRPEILSLDGGELNGFMQKEPGLRAYNHYFSNLLREQSHLLPSSEEALLAQAGVMSASPRNIHSMLIDADLTFGAMADEQGREVALTRGGYERFIRSADRTSRQEAFEKFLAGYEAHRNTLAATYAANIKQNIFFARARKHQSALHAALFADNVPVEVYTNLISTVREHLSLLHRYLAIRKRALGVDELHHYDLGNSLASDESGGIPYDKAVETVLASLAPMGSDHVAIARDGFEARWVDVYETPGKRGNAHSAGCYDTPPFIMLNYLDSLQGTYTLAHEMGHSLHTYYANRTQPYHYAYYSDFVSEVASIFNEGLLTDHLLKNAADGQVRLRVVDMQLNMIRHALFRQTLLAEFEKLAHEHVEASGALTADWLCDTYSRLNREYYGDGLVPDDLMGIEWAYLPHLYLNFMVYQYATGVAASLALVDQVVNDGESAAERVRVYLARGGSGYPIDVLRDAGVDMTTPEPIRQALALFGRRLDELETLLG